MSKSNPSFCYFLVESLTRRSKFEIVSPRIRKWKNVFQKDICQWRHCFPCSVTKFGDQNFSCVTAKTSPFSRVGFGWKNCLLTKLQMTYATLSTIEVQLFGKSWKSCRWFIRPESSSSDDVTLLLTCLDLGRAGLKTDVYRICKIIVGFFFFRETRMPRNKIAWSNCCILDLPSFYDTFKHLFSSCLFSHSMQNCTVQLDCVYLCGAAFFSRRRCPSCSGQTFCQKEFGRCVHLSKRTHRYSKFQQGLVSWIFLLTILDRPTFYGFPCFPSNNYYTLVINPLTFENVQG